MRLKNQEYTLEVFNQLELIYQLLHYQVKDNLKKDNLYISDGYDKRLKYITNKLKNNPCCLDSLYQLAKEANSSLRTINRLFEKETGLTFSQWRHHLRMMIAIEKLLQGSSITKIAFEVGYQSSNSFSTAFHKYMGQPPQKYLLNYKAT
ncbi:helix-turn-helix domain-containing protein [Acinetobacter rathckeae]|nr:helix-turn-helix domain-containing protein [Acinetobacter rathckeae]MBF7696333.1 AraC family transcriptional regulator [Acinetobacter rathckeae]